LKGLSRRVGDKRKCSCWTCVHRIATYGQGSHVPLDTPAFHTKGSILVPDNNRGLCPWSGITLRYISQGPSSLINGRKSVVKR
jgi:hypothetical protein